MQHPGRAANCPSNDFATMGKCFQLSSPEAATSQSRASPKSMPFYDLHIILDSTGSPDLAPRLRFKPLYHFLKLGICRKVDEYDCGSDGSLEGGARCNRRF